MVNIKEVNVLAGAAYMSFAETVERSGRAKEEDSGSSTSGPSKTQASPIDLTSFFWQQSQSFFQSFLYCTPAWLVLLISYFSRRPSYLMFSLILFKRLPIIFISVLISKEEFESLATLTHLLHESAFF